MINLARMHCVKKKDFKLVDVPVSEAKQTRLKLIEDGWQVVHTEVV